MNNNMNEFYDTAFKIISIGIFMIASHSYKYKFVDID